MKVLILSPRFLGRGLLAALTVIRDRLRVALVPVRFGTGQSCKILEAAEAGAETTTYARDVAMGRLSALAAGAEG